jgi:hypothetical protein
MVQVDAKAGKDANATMDAANFNMNPPELNVSDAFFGDYALNWNLRKHSTGRFRRIQRLLRHPWIAMIHLPPREC